MKHTVFATTLIAVACFSASGAAQAQVAGSTTTSITVTEATQVAMGWSVNKTLLGKTIYNDAGDKVGQVIDLIISPDRDVSYVIVGAGGFIGIGRHDVAIPIRQIQEREGKLLMAGATKGTIRSTPPFIYADDAARRDKFVADAELDLSRARAKVAELQLRSTDIAVDAKAQMYRQIDGLQRDINSADKKLNELKRGGASRWHRFESAVGAAMARLRKALETA